MSLWNPLRLSKCRMSCAWGWCKLWKSLIWPWSGRHWSTLVLWYQTQQLKVPLTSKAGTIRPENFGCCHCPFCPPKTCRTANRSFGQTWNQHMLSFKKSLGRCWRNMVNTLKSRNLIQLKSLRRLVAAWCLKSAGRTPALPGICRWGLPNWWEFLDRRKKWLPNRRLGSSDVPKFCEPSNPVHVAAAVTLHQSMVEERLENGCEHRLGPVWPFYGHPHDFTDPIIFGQPNISCVASVFLWGRSPEWCNVRWRGHSRLGWIFRPRTWRKGDERTELHRSMPQPTFHIWVSLAQAMGEALVAEFIGRCVWETLLWNPEHHQLALTWYTEADKRCVGLYFAGYWY